MSTLIMKFGGTSVGNAEAIAQACSIVKSYHQDWERLVVVVSAMRGVTDSLIKCAELAVQGEEDQYQSLIEQLRANHRSAMEDIVSDEMELEQLTPQFDEYISELSEYCRSIHVLGEVTARGMDTITSLGERINAPLVAAALRGQGLAAQAVDAAQLIVTDNSFQNANPLEEATRIKVNEILVLVAVLVVLFVIATNAEKLPVVL